MNTSALSAAVQAAGLLGVAVNDPEIVYAGSSTIVRVAPDGPVARVGGMTAVVRDLHDHYQREVELAQWLTASKAPVVPPWNPAGPVRVADSVVSFWTQAGAAGPASGPDAGGGLRRCHASLARFPARLPDLESLFVEAASILRLVTLTAEDRRRLDRALASSRAIITGSGLPIQPLHGDAGLGNVLPDGIWLDWEDACPGPVLWDLACLVSSSRITGQRSALAEAALVAYGPAPGLEQLDAFVFARGIQVLAWSLLFSERQGTLRDSTRTRLEWLRRQPDLV